jgi:hypothetical protein
MTTDVKRIGDWLRRNLWQTYGLTLPRLSRFAHIGLWDRSARNGILHVQCANAMILSRPISSMTTVELLAHRHKRRLSPLFNPRVRERLNECDCGRSTHLHSSDLENVNIPNFWEINHAIPTHLGHIYILSLGFDTTRHCIDFNPNHWVSLLWRAEWTTTVFTSLKRDQHRYVRYLANKRIINQY